MDSLTWTRLISVQVGCSSASFLASSFIAVAVIKSDGGMSAPYSRIIFGLSVSDMFQSLAMVLGPFMAPNPGLGRWAVGNMTTCRMDALLITIASVTTPMYYVALCIYTFFRIKTNMTNAVIATMNITMSVTPTTTMNVTVITIFTLMKKTAVTTTGTKG